MPELAHALTSLESRLALAKVLRDDDVSALDAKGDRREGLAEVVGSEAGADCEAGGI